MHNRLAQSSSPYLRQHADNPVHWQPWDAAALAQARARDLPILLSIGYSACHWCHVMAHESFADAQTAALMNSRFVNIKVDREERPDLDRIYQLAHQALTERSGGWPLTVFLSPHDLLPFFAGTYFPKSPRYGMPAFADLLQRVSAWFAGHREQAAAQSAQLQAFLQRQYALPQQQAMPPATRVADAEHALLQRFDPHWGGFGSAPKFPHSGDLELLLASDSEPCRAAALHSLTRMAEGGIHDQLGGGFSRYSVDKRWEIPHFEKMLYDNALLLPLYAKAAALSGETHYRATAEAIARWLEHEMHAPDGGYYAALDADSEGEEGRFYVWDNAAVRAVLPPDVYTVAAAHWGLDAAANFEGRHWHLHIARPLAEVANALGISLALAQQHLDTARARLLAMRHTRIRPALDDKRLTAWNAMLASGYARAAAALDHPDWIQRARAIVAFIDDKAMRDGRLHASVQGGEAQFAAYLDDTAWLLLAHLDLLAVDPDPNHLHRAIALADSLLAHFEDSDGGGFFFTADDQETLPVRPRSFIDEATPAGAAIAAQALLRLAWLLAEPRYLDAVERCLCAGNDTLHSQPAAAASLLLVLRDWHAPATQLVLRLPHQRGPVWQPAITAAHRQGIAVIQLPCASAADDPLPMHPGKGDGIAYLCTGSACLAPISDPDALLRELQGLARRE
ncbi:MAG: thioredoxin domain-containing protein [Lysobacterales bacterium CG17_big_fil_post_rev_8_21_14_2_50_64_11]|nr:MAG: thioredoxin domain-containing protein [Xanthomonadales bacterium CG17_big_fil_post_rev_8_21_14_2_50_64_11]PIX60903.1 MAG: thioredoxin domain-containing protein [Xanthomonadales bacterium CG_4_10_14_3_um_filter_64_11]